MALEMTHYHEGDIVVVTANGDINSATARDFGESIQSGIDNAPDSNIVLDMSGVYYMSSAGLRDIVSGLKNARRKGGDLRIAGVQARLKPVFEMVGFAGLSDFYDTVEEAVTSYS